jgi:AcrR family transcriptional regulator
VVGGHGDEAPSRREREKAAHRREILVSAARVFERKGFAAATIDEIAQEAEFSKGAVYLHFASKEELLATILLELLDGALAMVRGCLAGQRPLRQELGDLYTQAARLAFAEGLERCCSQPLHLTVFGSLSDATRQRLEAGGQELMGHLHRRLAQAQQQGEVGPINLEAAAGLIHGALHNMVQTRWGRASVAELSAAADRVIEIIFDGIARRKE